MKVRKRISARVCVNLKKTISKRGFEMVKVINKKIKKWSKVG